MDGGSVVTGSGVVFTPAAARRVAALKLAEGRPQAALRLSVSGGGCSGFRYGFDFDDAAGEDDLVVVEAGERLLVDAASLELLGGAVVDYVEDMMGASFQVKNPNAVSSCGCGSSFSPV